MSNYFITLNDLIKKLQQLRKAVPGNTEIRLHEQDNIIECGDWTLKLQNAKLKHITYCCYRCLHDNRCLSKDGKHRLCGRCACEVTIEECEEMRKNFVEEKNNG